MLSYFQKWDIFSLKTFAGIENISYLCVVMIRERWFKSFKPSAASAVTIEANAGNVLPGVRTLRKIPPRVVPEYGESATDRHRIREDHRGKSKYTRKRGFPAQRAGRLGSRFGWQINH